MKENVHIVTQGDKFLSHFALALKKNGYTVSCSDFASECENEILCAGIIISSLSHYCAKGGQVNLLAIPEGYEGADLLFAESEHIPVVSIYDLLANLTENKARIIECNSRAVGRISSLIIHVMQVHSKKADYVLDMPMKDHSSCVSLSENTRICIFDGDLLLHRNIENCNSDILILSSLRWRENSIYPTFEDYIEDRHKLIKTINRNGMLVYNQSVATFQEWVDTLRDDITAIPFKKHKCRFDGGTCYLQYGNDEIELPFACDDDILCDINAARLVCRQFGVADKSFYDSLLSVDFIQ